MNEQYIVFDGVDLSGKSTALEALSRELTENGIKNRVTKHPGATWIGQKIRSIVKDPEAKVLPITRAMLLAADNMAFHEEIAKPMVGTGEWLFADRNNITSALAYQIADGIPIEQIARLHSSLISPRQVDQVLIFDISWETRVKRLQKRQEAEGKVKDYFERDKEHFLKLKNAYLNMASEYQDVLKPYIKSTNGKLNFIIIDSNGDEASIRKQVYDALGTPWWPQRLLKTNS